MYSSTWFPHADYAGVWPEADTLQPWQKTHPLRNWRADSVLDLRSISDSQCSPLACGEQALAICRRRAGYWREQFSPQFSSSPKIRSMDSVSFATLKAEKTRAWQTPQTLCREDFRVLTLLCDRLPPRQWMAINAVDLDMPCFLPSSNDLPTSAMTQLFYDFLVRWVQQLEWHAMTKFLSDWREGPIHPSSLGKELLFYLPKTKLFSPTEGSSHSSSHPAPNHIAGRANTCSSSMSCPSICETIQITSIPSIYWRKGTSTE